MSPALQAFWHRYGLTATLSAIAVGVLVVIGYETDWGQSVRSQPASVDSKARSVEIATTLPPFSLPALDNGFRESGDRPLFTPSRRPAATNLAAVPSMKKGQFKLTGTLVNGDLTVAYLVETASGKTLRVERGREVNGMTLEAVEPTRIVLKQGDETEELILRTAASPPRPVAPPPAPGAAPGQVVPPGQPTPLPPSNTPGAAALPGVPLRPPGVAVGTPASNPTQAFQFFSPPPQATPDAAKTAAPATSSEAAAAAQRRRRFQNLPQQ